MSHFRRIRWHLWGVAAATAERLTGWTPLTRWLCDREGDAWEAAFGGQLPGRDPFLARVYRHIGEGLLHMDDDISTAPKGRR